MEVRNRGGGYDLMMFNEQKSIATKLLDVKPQVKTQHQVAHKQIRDDFLCQMRSMQRKRKSEIANENLRIFKKIQEIQVKPSNVQKQISGYYNGDLSPLGRDFKSRSRMSLSMHGHTASNMSRMASQNTANLPAKLRIEQARIDAQNAKFDRKLSAVRPKIQSTKHNRQQDLKLMDSYMRFASKYKGVGPQVDPLVSKKLKEEQADNKFVTRNMHSVHGGISQASLGNISIDYNEGSAVAKRNSHLKNSRFLRKSQSISAMINSPSKYKNLHQVISTKDASPSPQATRDGRQHSNDLIDVLKLNTDETDQPLAGLDISIPVEPVSKPLLDQSLDATGDHYGTVEEMGRGLTSQRLPPANSQLSNSSQSNFEKQTRMLLGGMAPSATNFLLPAQKSGKSRTQLSMSQHTDGAARKARRSPTLLRAVDSSVQVVLSQAKNKERQIVKQRARMRTKEMDLKDLISRLEGAQGIQGGNN